MFLTWHKGCRRILHYGLSKVQRCGIPAHLERTLHTIKLCDIIPHKGQACRKLEMEESPSEPPVKKKRPTPKTPRPKKKKTDSADPGGGGDGTVPEISRFFIPACTFMLFLCRHGNLLKVHKYSY